MNIKNFERAKLGNVDKNSKVLLLLLLLLCGA